MWLCYIRMYSNIIWQSSTMQNLQLLVHQPNIKWIDGLSTPSHGYRISDSGSFFQRTQRNWTLKPSCLWKKPDTADHILGCFHSSEMPRTHKATEAAGRAATACQGAGEWLLVSSRFPWGWWKWCRCRLYGWLHNSEYTKSPARFKWVNCIVPNYISAKLFFKEQKETYFPAHCSYRSMFLKMLHLASPVVSWKAKAAWWCSSTAMSL